MYTNEKITKNTPLIKRSIWWSWKDANLDEMKAFLRALINMAMNHKSELNDYFSIDWVDCQPFFRDIFSKEKFLQIFWNIHISPTQTGPIRGTLTHFGKVCNVVLYLDKKFREYVPKKSQCRREYSGIQGENL